MSLFKCECCNETWDTNATGGLVPSKCPEGYWLFMGGNLDDCPACEYVEGTWKWVEQ